MKSVWTNGCFDLLHAGHVEFLIRARALGDHLTVWLNGDQSIRYLKGRDRPVMRDIYRADMLRALRCVDDVRLFYEANPVAAWERLGVHPTIYVKEAGAGVEASAEAAWLLRRGVAVAVLPRVLGLSTTGIIEKCRRIEQSSSTETAPSSTTGATSGAQST